MCTRRTGFGVSVSRHGPAGPLTKFWQVAVSRNRQAMMSTSDESAAPGFLAVKEPGLEWPDALILFEAEPTPADWDTLRNLMLRSGQLDNPTYKGK